MFIQSWTQNGSSAPRGAFVSYPCPSLTARAHFWHSPLKSSPPGCCRPESKHNKEIKYECEKLARMALSPLGPTALHNALRWQEKFMAICWIKRRRMGKNAMSMSCHIPHPWRRHAYFFTSLVQLLHASLRTNRRCWPLARWRKFGLLLSGSESYFHWDWSLLYDWGKQLCGPSQKSILAFSSVFSLALWPTVNFDICFTVQPTLLF